jgi:excisionase family DNA binding protein
MALTYAEAAAYMRTTPFRVARYVSNGKLPASRVGRVGIVFGEDVRAFLEENYRGPYER